MDRMNRLSNTVLSDTDSDFDYGRPPCRPLGFCMSLNSISLAGAVFFSNQRRAQPEKNGAPSS